jgi:hypothetical protein
MIKLATAAACAQHLLITVHVMFTVVVLLVNTIYLIIHEDA